MLALRCRSFLGRELRAQGILPSGAGTSRAGRHGVDRSHGASWCRDGLELLRFARRIETVVHTLKPNTGIPSWDPSDEPKCDG